MPRPTKFLPVGCESLYRGTDLTQRVVLIDGAMLADLMSEHGVGVRASQTLIINRLDEDFFSED